MRTSLDWMLSHRASQANRAALTLVMSHPVVEFWVLVSETNENPAVRCSLDCSVWCSHGNRGVRVLIALLSPWIQIRNQTLQKEPRDKN